MCICVNPWFRHSFVRVLIAVVAIVGLALSVYLTFAAWEQQARPVGCGPGSGCAAVLSSRWANVVGVPVSAPAAAVYAAALVVLLCPVRTPPGERGRWSWLLFCATLTLLAALWFTALQWLVLGRACAWCMTTHLAGMVFAGLVFTSAPLATLRPRRVVAPMLAGLLLVAGLATTQLLVEPRTPPLRVAIGGEVELDVTGSPIIGPRDAPRKLVMLFDYACPHCRTMHQHLIDAVDQVQGLSVVLVPVPLNAGCNAMIDYEEARFAHSCELARTALAVWRAAPATYFEFDRWLFAQEQPPTAAAARLEAQRLLGPDQFDVAWDSPWPDDQIRRNVELHRRLLGEPLPLLLGRGLPSVERSVTLEELLSLLGNEGSAGSMMEPEGGPR